MQDNKNSEERETIREKGIPKTMSNTKLALIIASPILAPIIMIAVMLFFMLIACGWFFVSVTFFTAAAAAAVGIVGIIGAFFNAVNGIGAVLLMLGAGIASLGFVYPTFIIGREMAKGFMILHRELMRKGKDIKNQFTKGVKEL